MQSKILYLTYESIEKEPIINSQVVPLINEINQLNDVDIHLFSIESNEYAKKNQVNVNNLIVNKHKSKVIQCFYYFKLLASVINRYKIIHVRSYLPILFLFFLKPFYKGEIIFDMRGVLPEETILQSTGLKKYFNYLLFKLIEFIGVKISKKIIVVSIPFKKYIIKKYGNSVISKTSVISTFSSNKFISQNYNVLREKINVEKNTKLFVYSGSLSKWQNFDKIVDLYFVIAKYIQNSKLIIFTKDKIDAELILDKKLNKNQYEVLFVKNNELSSYLSECDLGFLLRDDILVNLVSAPIKFKDYLASNVPLIISSKIGDSSEIIKKYQAGIIIDDFTSINSIEYFVKNNISKINNLINNKSTIEFDLIYKKELSKEIAVEKYKTIYNEILSRF